MMLLHKEKRELYLYELWNAYFNDIYNVYVQSPMKFDLTKKGLQGLIFQKEKRIRSTMERHKEQGGHHSNK